MIKGTLGRLSSFARVLRKYAGLHLAECPQIEGAQKVIRKRK